MINLNKKAVSPLIATILLIVVAVILVTIVLTWGKDFASSSLSTVDDAISDNCVGVSLSISNCTIDADNNQVTFFLRNISTDSYAFPDTEKFKVYLTDSSGNTYASELDLNGTDGVTAITGLNNGEMKAGKAATDVVTPNLVTTTGTIKVTVRPETVCPTDATATATCTR
jgi:flagellin-like protein